MNFYNKSTLSAWPHQLYDVPDCYKGVLDSSYTMIYSPVHEYIIAYGNNKIIYLHHDHKIIINKSDIIEVKTHKELLEASITFITSNDTITVNYVTSVYYLFDPLLDYALNLDKDFSLSKLEKQYPRSKSLYIESLCMYNYSLYAYRLGTSVLQYDYRYKIHRERFMPWKKHKEEWLTIHNTYGEYCCYSFKYVIDIRYVLNKTE